MIDPSRVKFRLRNGSRNKIIRKAKVTLTKGGATVQTIDTDTINPPNRVDLPVGAVLDTDAQCGVPVDQVTAELWFHDTDPGAPFQSVVHCQAEQGVHRVILTGYHDDRIALEVWWMTGPELFTASTP